MKKFNNNPQKMTKIKKLTKKNKKPKLAHQFMLYFYTKSYFYKESLKSYQKLYFFMSYLQN